MPLPPLPAPGGQEPLGLWSHPPSLCSIVHGPSPPSSVSFIRMMPVGFWGTQVIQDNLI